MTVRSWVVKTNSNGSISKEDRRNRNGHHSGVLWFTGLSGSGKSTIAFKLEEKLFQQGYQVFVLDGDNVRRCLNRDLGFSTNDRKENIRRIAEVAKLLVGAGILVIVAFISPYSIDRADARALFEEGEFTEVYVECPLGICEQRDVKGLYKKARKQEVKNFTGIDDIYEEPLNADIVVDTSQMTVEECVERMLIYLSTEKNRKLNKEV